MNIDKKPIRRALISVYDKTGLVELAQGLAAAGVEIVSTGSTAKTIADKAIPVTRVEELTGFPEVLDGDDEDSLHERIKVVERQLLVKVVAAIATGGVTVIERKATVGMDTA